jgi:hypothetical protein
VAYPGKGKTGMNWWKLTFLSYFKMDKINLHPGKTTTLTGVEVLLDGERVGDKISGAKIGGFVEVDVGGKRGMPNRIFSKINVVLEG